jgi:plasmid stabilization system protein ParE
MYERFVHAFAMLGKTPDLGMASDRIELGVRKFPVGNYLIYYGPRKNRVSISRVIHGRRRQKKASDQPWRGVAVWR